MPTSFAVTTTSGQVRLDEARRASVSYTVTNRRGQECRGRVSVAPMEGAQAGWFTIAGLRERPFGIEETHNFLVEIAVPAGVPAGTYALRLDVVAEDNPDEDYTQGPAVAFAVGASLAPPPPERAGYLRTIAGTAVGALAGLAAGGFLALLLGIALAVVTDDVAVVVAIIIALLVPWAGAVVGSWQALRMGDYGRARKTGIFMAGIFPVWEGLLVGAFALLANAGDIPGAVVFVIVLLIIAPSWVLVPALASRFAALRLGGSQATGAPGPHQPVPT